MRFRRAAVDPHETRDLPQLDPVLKSDYRSGGVPCVAGAGVILAQNCARSAVWEASRHVNAPEPDAQAPVRCGLLRRLSALIWCTGLVHGDVVRVPGPNEIARARVAHGQRAGAPGGQVDVGAPSCQGHIFPDMRDVRAAQIPGSFPTAGGLGASGRTALLAVHGCNSSGSVLRERWEGCFVSEAPSLARLG
jgi:hypothetical protein